MKKAIEFAHDVLINKISTQDIFVDMTMGNGNDTLFLCKIAKFVYAFDIACKKLLPQFQGAFLSPCPQPVWLGTL